MNVALVYDRINKWGGAERVLLSLHKLFPHAPLYTTVYDTKEAPWSDVFDVRASFLQQIPWARSNHEYFPFLSSVAFEQFSFDEYDVVISVTSAEAKGIITKPETLHVCYCLTPTRYLWSHYGEYFSSPFIRVATRPLISSMRIWDQIASTRPDHYIAISNTVRDRIKKYYRRDSDVIFPPVEMSNQSTANSQQHGIPKYQIPDTKYFLIVSRLVKYKKIDLAIRVFNALDEKLIIVGKGREERRLKQMAGPNIEFLHDLTDQELSCYYTKSQGLLMMQEEDFGLAAVEAQSHGTGVVAYNKGGVRDTVIDGKTGVLFNTQTEESIMEAVGRYSKLDIQKEECVRNSKRFSERRFRKEFTAKIEELAKKKGREN